MMLVHSRTNNTVIIIIEPLSIHRISYVVLSFNVTMLAYMQVTSSLPLL